MLHEEELLYLKRCGCPYAEIYLFDWIRNYVQGTLAGLTVHVRYPNDYLDIEQQCIIACENSFDTYRIDKDCSLKTYLRIIIKNKTFSIFKLIAKDILSKYENPIYLDADCNGICNEEYVETNKLDYNPLKQLKLKEEKVKYQNLITSEFSEFEQLVMYYKVEGYSHKEITGLLNVDIKRVYNAIYRIQKKLTEHNTI